MPDAPNPPPSPRRGRKAAAPAHGAAGAPAKAGGVHVWSFEPVFGGWRVSKARPCPICGRDHKCRVSAEGAVACGRVQKKAEGFAVGAVRQGADGARYGAVRYRPPGGGSGIGAPVWAPFDDAAGRPREPAELTAEAWAERGRILGLEKQAKRDLARGLWRDVQARGDAAVDHPMVREYLRGRGISPDWFPDGRVPACLRFAEQAPLWYDFQRKDGTKHPLITGYADGAPVWRELADVPPPSSGGPGMVAAVWSPNDRAPERGGTLRGLHVTYLKREADGTVAKHVRRAVPPRNWIGSCDGFVPFAGVGATKEDPYPRGVLITGEGLESTASGYVASLNAFTAWALLSDNGVHDLENLLPPEAGTPKLHTVIHLVDLDRLTTAARKRPTISRTGQISAAEVKARLEALRPGLSFHPVFMRAEHFGPGALARPLVRLAGLEPGSPEAELAAAGGLGCAVRLAPDGAWEEHQPIDPTVGVDWNDALRAVGDPELVGAAIIDGVDWEANAARARAWCDAHGGSPLAPGALPSVAIAPPSAGGPGPLARIGPRGVDTSAGAGAPPGGGDDGGRGGVGGGDAGGGDDGGDDRGGDDPLYAGLQWWEVEEKVGEDGEIRRHRRLCVSSRGVDRARLFLLQCCRVAGERRFRVAYWAGRWYWWSGGVWQHVDDVTMASRVTTWLMEFWHARETRDGLRFSRVDPSERAVGEVLAKIAHETLVRVDALPAWLPDNLGEDGTPLWGSAFRTMTDPRERRRRRDEPPGDFVVDELGMIRLSWLVELWGWRDRPDGAGGREDLERLRHTPSLLTAATLPYALPLEDLAFACLNRGWTEDLHRRHCPTWWRALRDWCGVEGAQEPTPDARARIRQLGLMFGYSLSGSRVLEKIFVLPGPTRSGKGVLEEALLASHGVECVGPTTLTALGQQFGLVDLVGKTVALMSDAHVSAFTNAGSCVENLKLISGNGLVRVEPKFGEAMKARLQCQFWAMMNDEPDKLQDNSGALAGRNVIWPFTRSFLGKDDYRVKAGVKGEGAGIGAWALAHAAELFAMERPEIGMTELAQEQAEELRTTSSHMDGFARDCLECEPQGLAGVGMLLRFHPEREVELRVLYNAYLHWCRRHDRRPYGHNKLIGKIRPLVDGGLRTPRPKTDDGKRPTTVVGIELRTEIPPEWRDAPPPPEARPRAPTAGTAAAASNGAAAKADRGDDDGAAVWLAGGVAPP